jgi:hypothetical protein
MATIRRCHCLDVMILHNSTTLMSAVDYYASVAVDDWQHLTVADVQIESVLL